MCCSPGSEVCRFRLRSHKWLPCAVVVCEVSSAFAFKRLCVLFLATRPDEELMSQQIRNVSPLGQLFLVLLEWKVLSLFRASPPTVSALVKWHSLPAAIREQRRMCQAAPSRGSPSKEDSRSPLWPHPECFCLGEAPNQPTLPSSC